MVPLPNYLVKAPHNYRGKIIRDVFLGYICGFCSTLKSEYLQWFQAFLYYFNTADFVEYTIV
jgi:hypothetical protein